MNYKRATKIYRETNEATIPVIEYVLLLLKEVLENVRLYEALIDSEDSHSRKKPLLHAQELLFELMATTNQNIVEGERLFSLYVYLNQRLVEVLIKDAPHVREHVKRQLEELIISWEEAKQTSRLEKYPTPWI